jgi:hypothetical protein
MTRPAAVEALYQSAMDCSVCFGAGSELHLPTIVPSGVTGRKPVQKPPFDLSPPCGNRSLVTNLSVCHRLGFNFLLKPAISAMPPIRMR